MKVPHVPWTPEEKQLVTEVDEKAWVREYPGGRNGKTRGVWFQRMKWPWGGYITRTMCYHCHERHQAGGLAGERGLELWAERHDCKALPAQYEVDEDKRLFR